MKHEAFCLPCSPQPSQIELATRSHDYEPNKPLSGSDKRIMKREIHDESKSVLVNYISRIHRRSLLQLHSRMKDHRTIEVMLKSFSWLYTQAHYLWLHFFREVCCSVTEHALPFSKMQSLPKTTTLVPHYASKRYLS